MKPRQINVFGRTNEAGQLQLQPELKAFLQNWPNCRVVAKFIVLAESPSEALKGYYYHYIVPTMKTAMWDDGERMTEEETERRLRELSPITCEKQWFNDFGRYETELKEIADLTSPEMVEHIDTIKQIAAEEYGIYIEEPQTICNKTI